MKNVMKKMILVCAAVALLAPAAANANVLISANLYQLLDADGNDPGVATKIVIVVDKDNDELAGFDLSSASADTFLCDADDVIISSATDSTGGPAMFEGYYTTWLVSGDYQIELENGVDTGDSVYLFWYPYLAVDATAPGESQQFGVYYLGVVPPNTGALTPTNQSLSLTADYVTVPEPMTISLLLIGGGLLAARRRNRGNA